MNWELIEQSEQVQLWTDALGPSGGLKHGTRLKITRVGPGRPGILYRLELASGWLWPDDDDIRLMVLGHAPGSPGALEIDMARLRHQVRVMPVGLGVRTAVDHGGVPRAQLRMDRQPHSSSSGPQPAMVLEQWRLMLDLKLFKQGRPNAHTLGVDASWLAEQHNKGRSPEEVAVELAARNAAAGGNVVLERGAGEPGGGPDGADRDAVPAG